MKPNTLCFWGEGQKRRKERNVEQSPLTPPDFILFAFACFTVLTHLNNLTKSGRTIIVALMFFMEFGE